MRDEKQVRNREHLERLRRSGHFRRQLQEEGHVCVCMHAGEGV